MRFDRADAEIITRATEEMSATSRQTISMDRLVNNWRRLVADVARGDYNWSIHEYYNDVATRTLLESIRLRLSGFGRHELDAVLRPLDSQFEETTVPTVRPSENWWELRVPRRCGPELAEDLRTRGLAPNVSDAET